MAARARVAPRAYRAPVGGAAVGGDTVGAPPAPALLAFFGQQPDAGEALVHPTVFGSVLPREPAIVEYQVRQTAAGAEVLVVGTPGDPAAIGDAIEAGLKRAGLAQPSVVVRLVDGFERQQTGKVRRFVPLTP